MRESDLLKSDASSDEKTFYAEERVRRRYRRRPQDSDVPELERIVTRVAKLRPQPQAQTHRLPLFRTQSNSIFDAISRENFELRRQNEELTLEVQRLQEELEMREIHRENGYVRGRERDRDRERVRGRERDPRAEETAVQIPTAQPEWVGDFFSALKTAIGGAAAPAKESLEVAGVVKELRGALEELLATISAQAQAQARANTRANTQANAALQTVPVPAPAPAAHAHAPTPAPAAPTPAAYAPAAPAPAPAAPAAPAPAPAAPTPAAYAPAAYAPAPAPADPCALYRAQSLDYTPPASKGTSGYTLEIIEQLKELKLAVNRPVYVKLEPSKPPEAVFTPDQHDAPPLSTSSSTIEHEEMGPDEARRFLEQLRDSDPKQYQQVLENIHRKISDGDSTNFQDFVHQRLGTLNH